MLMLSPALHDWKADSPVLGHVHLFKKASRLDAWPSPTAWKTNTKNFFLPSHFDMRHLLMSDYYETSKQWEIFHVLWWFDVLSLATNEKKKFPRGPWPLNVTHTVSFSLYSLSVYYILRTERCTFCSQVAQRGEFKRCFVASQRKLLNRATLAEYWIWQTAVFILAGTVMDFYWLFQVACSVWNRKTV